jgi:hypothetical protein
MHDKQSSALDTQASSPLISISQGSTGPHPFPYYEPLLPMPPYQTQALQAALQDNILASVPTLPVTPQDSKQFIINTGASITIVNSKKDFISSIELTNTGEVTGIASGLAVHGIGTIALWLWADDNTMQHITLPHCLYVLACPVGLLCPWHLAAHTGHMTDGFNALADHGILMCNSSKIHVNYDDSTGLPIVSTFGELNHFVQYCASLCSAYNTLTSSPPSPVVQFKQNLSPQK